MLHVEQDEHDVAAWDEHTRDHSRSGNRATTISACKPPRAGVPTLQNRFVLRHRRISKAPPTNKMSGASSSFKQEKNGSYHRNPVHVPDKLLPTAHNKTFEKSPALECLLPGTHKPCIGTSTHKRDAPPVTQLPSTRAHDGLCTRDVRRYKQ